MFVQETGFDSENYIFLYLHFLNFAGVRLCQSRTISIPFASIIFGIQVAAIELLDALFIMNLIFSAVISAYYVNDWWSDWHKDKLSIHFLSQSYSTLNWQHTSRYHWTTDSMFKRVTEELTRVSRVSWYSWYFAALVWKIFLLPLL